MGNRLIKPTAVDNTAINHPADTVALVNKLKEQKGITITHEEIQGSGHFFEEPHMDTMIDTVTGYVKRRLTETTR